MEQQFLMYLCVFLQTDAYQSSKGTGFPCNRSLFFLYSPLIENRAHPTSSDHAALLELSCRLDNLRMTSCGAQVNAARAFALS